MTVGEKIKEVRELKGMSQEELAKKMGYKDRSSISKNISKVIFRKTV